MVHTTSPVTPIAHREDGGLDGFESTCSCGLVMRNTVRSNVELDRRDHLAYWGDDEIVKGAIAPRSTAVTNGNKLAAWSYKREYRGALNWAEAMTLADHEARRNVPGVTSVIVSADHLTPTGRMVVRVDMIR